MTTSEFKKKKKEVLWGGAEEGKSTQRGAQGLLSGSLPKKKLKPAVNSSKAVIWLPLVDFCRITHSPWYTLPHLKHHSCLESGKCNETVCLSIQTLSCIPRLGELAKDFR